MDPSVAPGDDFFGYANGGWVKTHRDPGRPPQLRHLVRARRPVAAAHEGAPRGGGRREGGAVRRTQDRRLLRQLHGRGDDRGEGPRAAAPGSRRASTPSPTGRRWPAGSAHEPARRRRSAEHHQLPHRTAVRRCGSRRTSTIRAATRRTCCRAASACPTASTTSTPRRRMAEHARRLPGAHRQRARRSPALRTPQAKAARIFDLERRIADAHGTRDGSSDVSEGEQPLDARRSFDTQGARHRLDTRSWPPALGSAAQPPSSSGSRAR